MAVFSNDEINNIRANADIVNIIGSYIPLTQKGRNYLGVCPFHDDHSPSMSVSPEKQIYKCFACGKTGNVFTFVSDYEIQSFFHCKYCAIVLPQASIVYQPRNFLAIIIKSCNIIIIYFSYYSIIEFRIII